MILKGRTLRFENQFPQLEVSVTDGNKVIIKHKDKSVKEVLTLSFIEGEDETETKCLINIEKGK